MFVKIQKDSLIICTKAVLADKFVSRFFGLMFKKSIGKNEGLLLSPCNQIHTFFMNFPIDAVTLDANNKILFLDYNIVRGKMRPFVKGGKKVLEMNGGEIEKIGLQIGDVLDIIEIK